LEQIEKDEQAH